jgi:outer membrane protein TolC
MHRKTLFAFLLLALPLRAQVVPPAPSDDPQLAALLKDAVAANPDVAQAEALAAASRSRPSRASALPDPMVSIGYENDGVTPSLGTEPMTRLSFMATQAFPYPGKLRLAGDVAAKEAERAAVGVTRARLEIAAAVRRAYADLLLARESRQLLADQEKTWGEIEKVSRIRYGSGSGSQSDILRAQAEQTRLKQAKAGLDAAERSATVTLDRLLFRPLDTPIETAARLAPPVTLMDAPALRALAEDASADLAEARIAQEESALVLALARRDKRPDFTAAVGYMNRGSLPLMWQASVGVTVPLWSKRKQRKGVDEMGLRWDAARASEASVRSRLVAATQERRIALARLVDEIRLDQSALLLQDQMTVDAALATYRTATGTFLTVLEALNTWFADRRLALVRLADYRKTEADLYAFNLEFSAAAPASSGAGM